MKEKRTNVKKGFTIVELMLYMGLLAIFLTVISQIFVASIDTQLESESQSSVQQDSKFILARMQYGLENATAIIEPSESGSSSSQLQFITDGITQSYQLTGQSITFTDNGNVNQVNSVNTTASNLQFTRRGTVGGKAFITVVFTLTSVAIRNSGPETQTFQTTIGAR